MILLPLICVGYGLWQLLAGDTVWSWHESRLRGRGIVSVERTSQWELRRKASGCLLLVMGALFLFLLAPSSTRNPGASRAGAPESGTFKLNGTPISRDEARSLGLPVD